MSIKNWPCWAKIGVVVGLVVFVLNWPTSSSEWAAWVQAFGSIGAIIAAIAIMQYQSHMQARAERKEREVFLDNAVSLLNGMKLRLTSAADNKKLSYDDSEIWNAFAIDLACIEMVNLEKFESGELRHAFINTRASLNLLVRDIAVLKNSTQFSQIMRERVQLTLNSVDGFLERVGQSI